VGLISAQRFPKPGAQVRFLPGARTRPPQLPAAWRLVDEKRQLDVDRLHRRVGRKLEMQGIHARTLRSAT